MLLFLVCPKANDYSIILTDEICDKLCEVAKTKSREISVEISFAICDENTLPRVYRRFGDALVLSITLVLGKAYTSAVTQWKTKDVAQCAKEGLLTYGNPDK